MPTKTIKNETLKFYKLHPNAKDPIYATEGSACFDHSEMYSDRAELNNMMLTILSEIQSRERD